MEPLGLVIHPHTFTHSSARCIFNNAGNLAKLKQLFGHSPMKSAEYYYKYTALGCLGRASKVGNDNKIVAKMVAKMKPF